VLCNKQEKQTFFNIKIPVKSSFVQKMFFKQPQGPFFTDMVFLKAKRYLKKKIFIFFNMHSIHFNFVQVCLFSCFTLVVLKLCVESDHTNLCTT